LKLNYSQPHTYESTKLIHPLQTILTMLRRKPTAIAITSEDITAFEEARLRKQNENREPEQAQGTSAKTKANPSDELKPLPGDKARILRREERIGLGHRG
jgi:hypothetical protein